MCGRGSGMDWNMIRGIKAGVCAVLAATLIAAGSTWAADADSQEKVLGRFPAVIENGRKLAKVNLRDLLQLVMERNLALQSSVVSQDASRQTLVAAQERLQPTFTSSVAQARSVGPGFSSLAATAGTTSTAFVNLLGQNSQTVGVGLSQQDWLGITYSMAYQETRLVTQNILVQNEGDSPTLGSSTDPKDYSSLTGTVTIPLSQNWGRDFNRIPVEQAEVGVRAARLATRKQELSTLNNVAQAYWNLLG